MPYHPPIIPNPEKSYSSSHMNSIAQNPEADAALKYISHILMEEELEDQTCILKDSALKAAENSFYNILSDKCCSSTNKEPQNLYLENQFITCCPNTSLPNGCTTPSSSALSGLICNLNNHESSSILAPSVNHTFPFHFQPISSPCSPADSIPTSVDGRVESSAQSIPGPGDSKSGVRSEKESWNFHKNEHAMILDFANNRVIPVAASAHGDKRERKRRDSFMVEDDKQFAVFDEESDQLELFGKKLAATVGDDKPGWFNTDEAFQSGPGRRLCRQGQSSTGSSELVDMRILLIQCAEAVAAGNDHRTAMQLLMQIRQHSTPYGDRWQRLAHSFANALEARMAGTGIEAYTALSAKRFTANDMIKSCKLINSVSPFMNMSYLYTKHTICQLAEKAPRLHIIHFGVLYGFPWLSLIQNLSTRPGGPPVIRITGIEISGHSFTSAALEETGHCLASLFERFNVPFEYNAISKNWESIRLEDLHIDSNEATAVTGLYRFRYLHDETVVLNSHRDAVLNLIKRINPDVFIHGIVNGAYNAPFFISRFREALFYFSSIFDMFEANTRIEDPIRMVFEQEIHGREILNVVACEGAERFERPETYKQWKVRNLRAGLRPLPLNKEAVKNVKEQVQSNYNKDFMVVKMASGCCKDGKGGPCLPFLVGNLPSYRPTAYDNII